MCCCASANTNGTPNAYSWDGKHFSTRQPDPPTMSATDTLLYDEPGRCGRGLDCHSHHFAIVKQQYGGFALLVKHGGGDERIDLGYRNILPTILESLGTNDRYALLHDTYRTVKDAVTFATNTEAHRWRTAAAEGRIKTRKQRGSANIKVWIEPTV